MEALSLLSVFTIIMIVGLLITFISNKLKISNVLLLILCGLFLGYAARNSGLVSFSDTALVVIAILSLVLIVFDGSSRFSVKNLNDNGFSSLKLIGWFILFNLVIITPFVSYLFFSSFNASVILYSAVFAIIVAATDPATLFIMFKNKVNNVVEFLKIEAILNTPITILLPFLFLDLINYVGTAFELFESYFVAFFNQIIIGIGSGIFIGVLFFRAMKHFYSEQISPLAIITSALLAYIVAENLGGSGVLSVAVLGFVFGSVYVTHKEILQEFSGMLSSSLEILVFLLLGFIIQLDFSLAYFFKSFFIFLLLILARYLSVKLSCKDFTDKERLFISLNMPKGLGTAVLVFSLSVMGIEALGVVNNLVVVVMIYSLVLSTIVNFYSKKFIRININ
jgi:NhaP-type Na+/H+ or K+/H+ antiporter